MSGRTLNGTSTSHRQTVDEPLARRLEAAGWSRIPSCSWLVSDGGVPRCSYGPLRDKIGSLEAARFTVFDQAFIDEAIANWREHSPLDGASECSPKTCPSRWNRLLNSFHRSPRRAGGTVSSALLESQAPCTCGVLGKPVVWLDGAKGMVCSRCLLPVVGPREGTNDLHTAPRPA